MYTGLLPHQHSEVDNCVASLRRFGAALNAGETGVGKTFVALATARAMGAVPLVIGPKNARAAWEGAGKHLGVDLEYVSYGKLKGKVRIVDDPLVWTVDAEGMAEPGRYTAQDLQLENGNSIEVGKVYLTRGFRDATVTKQLPSGHFMVKQDRKRRLVDSEWLEEVKYGRGSFMKWRQAYEFIIFDEVHRCGGETSLNAKALIAAKRQCKYVLALSATAADDPRQMKALGFALGLHTLNGKAGQLRFSYRSWLLRHGCKPGIFGGFDFTKDPEEQKRVFTRMHSEIFPARGTRQRKQDIPGFPKTRLDVRMLDDESGKAAGLCQELHDLYQKYQSMAVDADGMEEVLRRRQALEILMVDDLIDMTEDAAKTSGVALFVSFNETLERLFDGLRERLGNNAVGFISGSQTGARGEAERRRYTELFQANKLDALVLNSQAGGESISLHDPVTQEDRTGLITPCDSARRFKQIIGRLNRTNGGFSVQYAVYFRGTVQEETANRLALKLRNLNLLNDASLDKLEVLQDGDFLI